MIGHLLRYENELVYRIIEEKTRSRRDRRHPRNSFIEKMISDAGLSSYTELKTLDGNRKE